MNSTYQKYAINTAITTQKCRKIQNTKQDIENLIHRSFRYMLGANNFATAIDKIPLWTAAKFDTSSYEKKPSYNEILIYLN